MAESSERELTPDEATYVTAYQARGRGGITGKGACGAWGACGA
jgi:hypothetical protein